MNDNEKELGVLVGYMGAIVTQLEPLVTNAALQRLGLSNESDKIISEFSNLFKRVMDEYNI